MLRGAFRIDEASGKRRGARPQISDLVFANRIPTDAKIKTACFAETRAVVGTSNVQIEVAEVACKNRRYRRDRSWPQGSRHLVEAFDCR